MSQIREIIRRSISPFFTGVEADALVDSLITAMENQQKVSIDAFNQAFLSTASESWLDQRAADIGLTRPEDVGLSDFYFRRIASEITSSKQVISTIHNLLEIFYGPDAVRSYITAQVPEPYNLSEGMDLQWEMDGKTFIYTVQANDFPSGSLPQTSAADLAAAITKSLVSQGSTGFADIYRDDDKNQKFVRLISAVKGPTSYIKLLGGQLEIELDFPNLKVTNNTTTVWQVQKLGSTMRFTWSGNADPGFSLFTAGDTVLLYGTSFSENLPFHNDLRGSYLITKVAPGPVTAGYFEVEAPEAIIQGVQAVPQGSLDDMRFALFQITRPYFNKKYALGWEPNGKLLRIYLPAVTRVVNRTLPGGAYLHLDKSTTEFNGTFGNSNVQNNRIEVITPLSFRFYQPYNTLSGIGGADLLAFGGHLSVNYDSQKDYVVGTTVAYLGQFYRVIIPSGPNFGGVVLPTVSSYWEPRVDGGDIDYIRRDGSITTVVMKDGFYHGIRTVNESEPVNNWSAFINYNLGDIVRYKDSLRLAQKNPATGANPDLDTSWFTLTNFYPTWTIGASYEIDDKVMLGDNAYKSLSNHISAALNAPPSANWVLDTPAKKPYTQTLVSNEIITIYGIEEVKDDASNPYPGPYIVDPGANYTLTSIETDLNQDLSAGLSYRTISVGNTDTIPDTGGYIAFNFGSDNEESPVPVVAKLKNKLILDPSYKFKISHTTGEKITFLSSATFTPTDIYGSDYPLYLTGTAQAREYCKSLIEDITALGINLEIIILYPNDIGFGNWMIPDGDTRFKDIIYVYAPDKVEQYGE